MVAWPLLINKTSVGTCHTHTHARAVGVAILAHSRCLCRYVVIGAVVLFWLTKRHLLAVQPSNRSQGLPHDNRFANDAAEVKE
jgi:uncharacterized membrane-anchored protein